jgi:hypothetical protein
VLRRYDFPIAGWKAYPLVAVLRRGVACRPTVVELMWLIRALNIIPKFYSEHETVARTTAPTKSDFNVEFGGEGLTPAWDVTTARVRMDPILRPDEMEIVMKLMDSGRLDALLRPTAEEEAAEAAAEAAEAAAEAAADTAHSAEATATEGEVPEAD